MNSVLFLVTWGETSYIKGKAAASVNRSAYWRCKGGSSSVTLTAAAFYRALSFPAVVPLFSPLCPGVFFLLLLPCFSVCCSFPGAPSRVSIILATGALCQECHLVERDEACVLPWPCGLSGLLKVKPFISCNTINIQISCKQLA